MGLYEGMAARAKYLNIRRGRVRVASNSRLVVDHILTENIVRNCRTLLLCPSAAVSIYRIVNADDAGPTLP